MPWPFSRRPKTPDDQPTLPSPPERGAPDPQPSAFNVGDVVVAAGANQSGAVAVQDAKRRPLKDPIVVPDGIDGVVKGVEEDLIFVAFGVLIDSNNLDLPVGAKMKVPAEGLETPAGRLPAGQPLFVLGQPDPDTLRVRTMLKFRKEDWFNKQAPDRRKWGFRHRAGRLVGDGPARGSMPFGDHCFCIEDFPGELRGPEDRECPGWYGYLKNTLAMDGDSVDVLLGPEWRRDPTVTVVEQLDAHTGATYQFKTIAGFDDPIAAFLKLWPDEMLGRFDVYTREAYFECVLPLLNFRHRGLGLLGWHERREDRATGLLKVPLYEGDKLDGGHTKSEIWGLPDAKGQIGYVYYAKPGRTARRTPASPLVKIPRRKAQTRPRIVVVQGGPRSAQSCPGQDGKTVDIVKHVKEVLTNRLAFNVDVIDLAVHDADDIVRPCKGCVSTSSLHCHWPCIAEGQRVATTRGLLPIEEVREGDQLTTGRVTRAWKTKSNAEVFDLVLSDGRVLRATADHPVRVRSVVKRNASGRVYGDEWVPVSDLKPGMRVPFPREEIAFPVRADEDVKLALMAGLVFGDGTWASDTPLWYFHDSESAHLEDVRDAVPEWVSVRRCSEPGMSVVTWSKETGRRLTARFGRKGDRVPVETMRDASKDEVVAFLRGWFATDGSACLRKGRASVTLYNKSFDCLRDAQILLQRLGIRSSVYRGNGTTTLRGKEHPRGAQLLIKRDVARFRDVVGFSMTKKQSVLAQSLPRKRTNWPAPWGKVVKIIPAGTADVYDLTVEDSHEFIVEGVPVHNCSCFGPGSAAEDLKDLMYEQDVYAKLEACAGMVFVTPVHWGAASAQMKAMFDRLVCANLTVTTEEAIEIFDGKIKDPEKTREASKSGAYDHLLRNHLEGRYAAFLVHGDDGADEYDDGNYPPSYDPEEDVLRDPKLAVFPLVNQLRYSGVFVPGDLVQGLNINVGLGYAEANDAGVDGMLQVATDTVNRLAEYLSND